MTDRPHVPRVTRLLAGLLASLSLVAVSSCSDGSLLANDPGAEPAPSSSRPPATTAEPDDAGPPSNEPGGRAGGVGAGDPYYPTLGNEGYDVERYELDFTVDGADLAAVVTIDAVATADLDSFNLDFTAFTIDDVRVDGVPAPHRLDGEELVVDPYALLDAGDSFSVAVTYHGPPLAPVDPVLGRVGWQRSDGVTFTSSEPYGAHLWFPSNDHPSDKAAFRFRLTVPEGITAVASGTLTSRDTAAGRTTWVWDHLDPMPTYATALAIGELELIEGEGPNGIDIRHAFAPSLSAAAAAAFADTGTMITDLEGLFGPYPFDSYGALVLDADLGYAMENQTLALFDRSIVDGSFRASRTKVHELAHHWFGNWVSPATWQDIWLNEGFATYAEELWLERVVAGYDVDAEMRAVARRPFGPIGDPGPDNLFGQSSYWRGALTMHALRRTVGDAAFFQTLRAWVDRFGGDDATTGDFVALASEVAGADVAPLIDAWLNSPQMPELP